MNAFERFIKANGLKKYEVADMLGVSPSFISRMCGGCPVPPRIMSIIRNNDRLDSSMFDSLAPSEETDLVTEMVRLRESIDRLIEVLEDGKE